MSLNAEEVDPREAARGTGLASTLPRIVDYPANSQPGRGVVCLVHGARETVYRKGGGNCLQISLRAVLTRSAQEGREGHVPDHGRPRQAVRAEDWPRMRHASRRATRSSAIGRRRAAAACYADDVEPQHSSRGARWGPWMLSRELKLGLSAVSVRVWRREKSRRSTRGWWPQSREGDKPHTHCLLFALSLAGSPIGGAP